jgi:orotate phosphoribosyltransferase
MQANRKSFFIRYFYRHMEMITIHKESASEVASKLLQIDAIKLNTKKPYIWSSGWKSPIYCDNRLSLSYPEIRNFIKLALADVVRKHFKECEVIAGVATAGIPQGALVADALGLPFIYVRPKPKEHGMGNQIEGQVKKGQKAVLIEDLVSTGGSSLKAAKALEDAGIEVSGMAAIFTYGFAVAEKNFADANINLVCLSDYNHLIQEALKAGIISDEQMVLLKSWRYDPVNWNV